MFSSISSYIWGGEAEAGAEAAGTTPSLEQPTPAELKATVEVERPRAIGTHSRRIRQHKREQSPQNGDDWVLIGNDPSPGSLNGDALDPLPPMSADSSVNGDQGDSDLTSDTSSTHVPVPRQDNLQQTQKCLRQAQLTKQRNTSKALSSKALKRSNKTVTCGRKMNIAKFSLPIKSAGFNKNLKQC